MVPGQTDGQEELLTLPDNAPRIRITAGVGTASQKSWHLRRPVTYQSKRMVVNVPIGHV